ncbi:hypothetical protein HUJ04_008262 [Dendroctonus ponderosae]|nr:hypothetical protein HUJ04_008262 [Dendroctonus ponderosae]KAH1008124.1 hypothetical protein HUJ05_008707 [Dendroctonus ponderosae]
MHRLQIQILGLSEGDDPQHQYGVAIRIFSEVEKSATDFVPLGDFVRLRDTYKIMNINQVYTPTNDKRDEEVEEPMLLWKRP